MIITSPEIIKTLKGSQLVECACDVCGTILYQTKRRIDYKFYKHQVCSSKCRGILRKKNTISSTCSYCEHELLLLPSVFARSQTKKFFCNHTCRAHFYNKNRSATHSIKKCAKIAKFDQTVERFYLGQVSERSTIRKVLIHLFGMKCSECNISEWNSKPITLQVDHINGDPSNHSPSNLRLICPNCHSQTDTFGGRNKGSGRKSRGMCLG